MFPIRDKRKRVIGFGGRVLDDSLPKYLNSPETKVFSKGKELYGLFELLEKNSRPAKILVVEGYMDVIALAQFGVGYAVAALGTAMSKVQIDLLFRFTPELVFCFDGDAAGKQAAWKAVETAFPCLKDGRQIKIMLLPQSEDPDTLVREEGLIGFNQRVASAQLLSDYFFEQIGNGLNLHTLEGRSQLMSLAKPQLDRMPQGFFREMMEVRLKELSGARTQDADKIPAKRMSHRSDKRQLPGKSPGSNLMRKIVSLLVQYPYLAKWIELQGADIEEMDFPGVEVLRVVFENIIEKKPENSGILLESFRDTPHNKTVAALANLDFGIPEGGEEVEFCGALNQLIKLLKENRMEALIAKVNRGESLTEEERKQFVTGGKI
jgi:DNA primase